MNHFTSDSLVSSSSASGQAAIIPLRPLLNNRQLREFLGRLLGSKPCQRTIQRWVRQGMPHHTHPGSSRRLFDQLEVYRWLMGKDSPLSTVQRAVDASYRNRGPRGPKPAA